MHVRSLVAVNGIKFELNTDFVAVVHGIKAHYSSIKGRSDSVVSPCKMRYVLLPLLCINNGHLKMVGKGKINHSDVSCQKSRLCDVPPSFLEHSGLDGGRPMFFEGLCVES